MSDWIVPGATIGQGLLGAVGQMSQNATNEKIARETRQLNWEMQQIAWNREDSAVQRRSADLEAAGLSKTLAAGGAAQTGQPIRAEPWTVGNVGAAAGRGITEGAATAMAFLKMQADITQTKAQADLIKTQKEMLDVNKEQALIINPLEAERRINENTLAKMTMPDNIARVALVTQGQAVKNRLAEIKVDSELLNVVRQRIENSTAGKRLTGEELNNTSKAIAIEMMRWNLDYAKRTGSPTTGLDMYTRAYNRAEEMGQDMLKKAGGVVDDIFRMFRGKEEGKKPVPETSRRVEDSRGISQQQSRGRW